MNKSIFLVVGLIIVTAILFIIALVSSNRSQQKLIACSVVETKTQKSIVCPK